MLLISLAGYSMVRPRINNIKKLIINRSVLSSKSISSLIVFISTLVSGRAIIYLLILPLKISLLLPASSSLYLLLSILSSCVLKASIICFFNIIVSLYCEGMPGRL